MAMSVLVYINMVINISFKLPFWNIIHFNNTQIINNKCFATIDCCPFPQPLQPDFDRMKMVIGRLSNEHNSVVLQAIEVKQTLLNFFFDSLSNDTKLYGFG